MPTFLIASFAVSFLLTVWYETSAFTEYMELFRLSRYCKVDEYLDTAKTNDWTYLGFLSEFYSHNFIVRLVSCPVCLSPWLSLVISFMALGFVSPFMFLLFNFGISFLGLSLYYGLKVLRKYAQ